MDEQERAARFVRAARDYSRLGWALIPLNGKVPRPRRWQTAKPEDPELAAGKWAEWGKRWNMGVVLAPSGLAVVEDDSEQGRQRLLELWDGGLPVVPTVQSGGRSLHLYFADHGYKPSSRDGLELRCGRQQVVVPPSVHPDTGREYEWLVGALDGEIDGTNLVEPVPGHVLEFFAVAASTNGPVVLGDDIREKDPGRHKTLLRLAGTMRNRGMDGDEIAVALLAVNTKRCKPPLPDEEVVELARDVARRYQPDHEQQRIEREAARLLEGAPPVRTEPPTGRLRTRPLAAVIATPVEFLIDDLVPIGTKTLTAGVGGLGKSSLLLAWAAPVTLAGGTVLVISYEDEASAVLRPRFEALGGDLDRLLELYVDVTDGTVTFPTDLPELEQVVRETKARMLIVDPVSASLDMKLDSHKDRDVRLVLGRLAKLAERERLAVLLNAHLNKAPGSDPYLRVSGSVAFYNASRSVVTVTRDPAEPDWHRLVTQHKSNYGVLAPIQRWKFELIEIQSPSGPITVARMVYVEIADDIDREDVLAPLPSGPGKRLEAEAVLVAELANGRRRSAEVKAAAAREGIAERTLKRAAQEMNVVVEEESTPSGRVTFWSLPQGVGPTSKGHSWPDPPRPHGYADSAGSERGVGPTLTDRPDPQRECAVCDRPFNPEQEGATLLRCPDCANRSQPKGDTP